MTPAGEFSHKVTVDPWPEDGVAVELAATAAEREKLRARFDLVDLASLSASVEIGKNATELVLAGTIEAVVTQTCVATLKPVTASLDVPLERRYRRQDAHEKMIAARGTADLDEELMEVEILAGDDIDIGDVVAEELYLALDPYPRAAGADEALAELRSKTGTGEGEERVSPFEKLRPH